MTVNKRDKAFELLQFELGFNFSDGFQVGGNYSSIVQDSNIIYISGQIPRIGTTIEYPGVVGDNITLEEAQLAAKICIMRALGIARAHLGTLGRVNKLLKMNVFIKASQEFGQHSQVSDGASEILHKIFADQSQHARTSVGVISLPKNAAVEIDLTLSSS